MSESMQEQAAMQAAYWRAQLSSDLLTQQQQREFEIWLADRPENQQAWLEIERFWSALDSLTEADVLVPQDKIIVLPAGYKKWYRGRLSKPVFAVAASLLLLVSLAIFQHGFYFADYRTSPGEQRTISLADGSEIILNTDSALSVQYADAQRQITLHQGEAYFVVAADALRPFEVQTFAGRVRALGTAFNINLQQDAAEVTVYQHAVKITTETGKVLEQLPEGKQIVFAADTLNAVHTANLQRLKAWRNQRMVFQDKPLVDVIAELNRYRPGKIMITSAAIKKLPVTGVFDTDDTNIALKTIEQSLSIKVTKITEKLVLLSAK
ncbi:MAG: FecR family protein [Methylococcales bacterium]